MTLTNFRVGCDVSKAWLDIFIADKAISTRIPNTEVAIRDFVATLPSTATVVFEATAPYDLKLRKALDAACLRALRVNPSRARDFARAAGFLAKTDAVDARMLARLPEALHIPEEQKFDADREELTALTRRRDQLVELRAMERGLHHAVSSERVAKSISNHMETLDTLIEVIEADIRAMLKKPAFAERAKQLASVKGVGPVTVVTLIALLPELGQRSAKAIAALVGLAPLNRDSGTLRGQRRIGGGRRRVRQALYMAALSAIRSVPRFNAFYRAIKERSGSSKKAVVAVARKLLVTLNAMIKKGEPFKA
jgi:transposase